MLAGYKHCRHLGHGPTLYIDFGQLTVPAAWNTSPMVAVRLCLLCLPPPKPSASPGKWQQEK